MKQKNYYLIWCVLFIFLMLPVQFGCEEAEDELQPQQTEEQATADAQGVANFIPPPLPETDPFGNPIDTADFLNSSNLKSTYIAEIYLTDDSFINNALDSWDIKCKHTITHSHPGYTEYSTFHYYQRNNGPWIGSGWKCHSWSGSYSVDHTWSVSFREGDVINTYAYISQDGVRTNKRGPTYTIPGPDVDALSTKDKIFAKIGEAVQDILGGISQGTGFSMPWITILNWFVAPFSTFDDQIIINVVDQDNNPLHAYTFTSSGSDNTINGTIFMNDNDYNFDGINLWCKEPNGPESYDDRLYGKYIQINAEQYDNSSDGYWGKESGNIPVITVTFNTNGTSTVDYPEPEGCILYDGTGLPQSPWDGGDYGAGCENIATSSGGILTLQNYGYEINNPEPFTKGSLETKFRLSDSRGEAITGIRFASSSYKIFLYVWANGEIEYLNSSGGMSSLGFIGNPCAYDTYRLELNGSNVKIYINGICKLNTTACTSTGSYFRFYSNTTCNEFLPLQTRFDYVNINLE